MWRWYRRALTSVARTGARRAGAVRARADGAGALRARADGAGAPLARADWVTGTKGAAGPK